MKNQTQTVTGARNAERKLSMGEKYADSVRVAELNQVIDAANTLIDFVLERNSTRRDITDGLNEIRSAAMNDLDDLTGASY